MVKNFFEVKNDMLKCCICNKEKKENIIILGKSICSDCEWKILTAKSHTTGYNKCISKLKNIFTT